jgi:hypothetical protein
MHGAKVKMPSDVLTALDCWRLDKNPYRNQSFSDILSLLFSVIVYRTIQRKHCTSCMSVEP